MLLLGSIPYMFAQTVFVLDKETLKPIESASLMSKNPNAFTQTNIDGMAEIKDFVGSENIEIRRIGYKTQIKSFNEIKKNNFRIEMEISTLNLNEVVISATRSRQNSVDIPSKIISLIPSEIALQNPQTSADLLGVSGELFIQKSQQGGGSPMIRGFATNRLLYIVDGVRMNTAIFRAGNIQNVINLDPFSFQNIEILFGPGSVIYGSDAIGGVMSFQTLSPQFSLNDKPYVTGKSLVRYASANQEQTGHFDVNIGFKKWAFISSISHFDFADLEQGAHGPDAYLKPYYVQTFDGKDHIIPQDNPLLQIPTAYAQTNIMQKIRFKPNKFWDIQYGFHYSETSPYGRYDRHNRIKNGAPRYAEWNYGPQIWMMNNLNIENTKPTLLYDQFNIRFAQQFFEESRVDRSLNKIDRNTQKEHVEAYSLNIDLQKKAGINHVLFYGIEYVINDVVSTGTIEDITTKLVSLGPSRYPTSKWSSAGVFLNDQYNFSRKITIQSGLRYSNYSLNSKFDTSFYPLPFTEANLQNHALTGSIGTVFHPTEKFSISFNLGTAFRAPNVDDIGKIFDSEPGSVVVPNPDLKAEYACNFDLGLAKIINDFLKFDLSAYCTLLDNALVRRDFTLNSMDSIMYYGEMSKVQAIQNAAFARIVGFQLGIDLKFKNGLGILSDFNYQKGEEELDDGTISPSRHAAPFFGIIRLFYEYNSVKIELYSNFQAEKSNKDLAEEEKTKTEIYTLDINGNAYSPAWYTINFKSSISLKNNWTIGAGIENITDQRYRPYSSGVSGAGRNFIISLATKF